VDCWFHLYYRGRSSAHFSNRRTSTGFLYGSQTQHIGSDAEHETVLLNGVALTEAKVLAFGVIPAQQRQGIGRALQEAALWRAERLGCYQVRSHSSGSHTANHALKLAMGFGVHPIVRGDDKGGVYFVMPLHPAINATDRRSP
jgi:GNAT superfamily N-acetyltransferase